MYFLEKSYDVFVVHDDRWNSDDSDFVLDQVLPYLEDQSGYTLCVAQRDFVSGERKFHGVCQSQ